MKIVFFGTDDFAATSLEALMREGKEIAAIVTQPDKARGRGMKVSLLPVKMLALERGIPILQPEELSGMEVRQQLKEFDADVFVVIAYGLFLPKDILEIPKKFCINVHGSLLPKYRGAAPINWAIINGEHETGVSVIRMNEQMDSGDVIDQEPIVISSEIDAQTLREKMADLGGRCLLRALAKISEGSAVFTPQPPDKVSFAPKLTREMGRVDWTRTAGQIHDQVRGLIPWPIAFTGFRGKNLKILETRVFDEHQTGAAPGTILKALPEGLVISCGEGQILVMQVHLDSSKSMGARSFSIGYQLSCGDRPFS